MSQLAKIAEIEAEYARTQKNKATNGHLGLLKAKMAKLRREMLDEGARGGGGGGGEGFDVRKSGDTRGISMLMLLIVLICSFAISQLELLVFQYLKMNRCISTGICLNLNQLFFIFCSRIGWFPISGEVYLIDHVDGYLQ